MRRAVAIALATLGAALFAGCYASTEPATNIGPESAKLRAQGTANNGPARSWFEYQVTGRVGPPLKTAAIDWPAGVSGPFSKDVSGLAASTPYSFRVCGSDRGTGEEGVCAQTRTFTTTVAVEDSAHGSWWGGCCAGFGVDARSGPSGESPSGTMNWATGPSSTPESTRFQGEVTCLAVDGRRAVIGAVGQRTVSPPGTSTPATLLVMIEDRVTAADHYVDQPLRSGSTPPDCENAEFSVGVTLSEAFEMIVNDAAPGAG